MVFPSQGWGIGIAIHGVVTALVVDAQGGEGTFSALFNEKVLRKIPVDDIKKGVNVVQQKLAEVKKD